MKNKKKKTRITENVHGITLVALVVTIIVLIILATISINIVFGDEGILERAKGAGKLWNQAAQNELASMNSLMEAIQNMLNGEGYKVQIPVGTISFTEPIWEDGFASIMINTTEEEYILQYKKGEEGEWTNIENGQSITGLTHNNIIYARLSDGVNASEEDIYKKIEDNTIPTVSLEIISGAPGTSGWSTGDVSVRITGATTGSEITKITYILSGDTILEETEVENEGSITINTNGTTKITAQAYTAATKSQIKTLDVKIDSIVPAVPTYDCAYKIFLGWEYLTSGYTTFEPNGNGPFKCVTSYDPNIVFNGINSKLKEIYGANIQVSALSKDLALKIFYTPPGTTNFSESNAVSSTITASGNSIMKNVKLTKNNYTNIRFDIGAGGESYLIHTIDLIATKGQPHNSFVNAILSNTDTAGSGFSHYQYKVGNGNWTNMGGNYQINATIGNYTVYYRAVDKAGNVSGQTSMPVNITNLF